MSQEESNDSGLIRLNKYLAHCGVGTRKETVELIKKGLVAVNGEVELQPFREMLPDDKVTFRGKPVEPQKKYVYFLLNKPGKIPFATPDTDNEGLTVTTLLQKQTQEQLQPAFPGKDTTAGLVVLTNDPDLIGRLSAPEHRIKTVYKATLDKPLSDEEVISLNQRLKTEQGQPAGLNFPDPSNRQEVGIEVLTGSDQWLVTFFQKNGLEVVRLDRTAYGPLTKKDLKRGWSRPLTEKEVVFLRFFH